MAQGVVKIFGERLRKLREEKGLTQAQLADTLHISRAALGYYENGRAPTIDVLDKVAATFDVPLDYLMGRTEAIRRENIAVCNDLGISEKSVENIKSITKRGFDMNLLFENGELEGIVEMLNKIKAISVGKRYRAERIEGGYAEILAIINLDKYDLWKYLENAIHNIETINLSGGSGVSNEYVPFNPDDPRFDTFGEPVHPPFLGSSEQQYNRELALAEFRLNQLVIFKLVDSIKNTAADDEKRFKAFDNMIWEIVEEEKPGAIAAIEGYLREILAEEKKAPRVPKGKAKDIDKTIRQERIQELERLIELFTTHIRKE